MKLREFEGKALFAKYGIPVPKGEVLDAPGAVSIPRAPFTFPVMVKAQVRTTDRKKAGGILPADNADALRAALGALFGARIGGETVESVLVEERLDVAEEYYLSFSYDTARRGPVLAASPKGGSGVHDASLHGINALDGLAEAEARQALGRAGFPEDDAAPVAEIAMKLWRLFNEEKAIVAEINPLLKTKRGAWYAGDAKVDFGGRRPVERMDGDIAVIASGGGASLLSMDALVLAGGRPANYAEYSGNPPREMVRALAEEVLSQKDIKACWVVGGTANFTDIYETMSGFADGLKQVVPKPSIPFVIRRGGPRQAEAFAMLKKFAEEEGFEFYFYGPETPMVRTARYVVDLAYKGVRPPSV